MRLLSLLSRLSILGSPVIASSAAVLKASTSFWGFRPVVEAVTWGRLAPGEAAGLTAGRRRG